MLSIRHPHPAAAPSWLRCVWPWPPMGTWENQSVFQLLSSRHSRNRHGGVGVSLLLSPRAVGGGGSVPPVSPLTCAVHLAKLVISVHRIVRLRVAINETLDPSHLSIRAYAQRMQLKSAVTAFGMEDTAPISALAPRASPNHSIPMHSRRDARDLRSGQEPDSSEGRGRKEVKTLALLRRRRLPSRGPGWLLPLDVYLRDDVLAVRLRFVPSHSRSPTPLSFRSPFSFFNPAARRSLLRSHEQT